MTADAGLDEQRASFEGFVALAHLMGATKLWDGETRIRAASGDRAVVLSFSHTDFPALRFAYRAKAPDEDRHEVVWLAEELATGALHRLLREGSPEPDADGLVWLHLHGQMLCLGA